MAQREHVRSDGPAIALAFTSRADGDFAIDSDPELLRAARSRVTEHPWTWLRQVHGAEVVVVTHPGDRCGAEADASVTVVPGAALAVQTADCAPVLFVGTGPDTTVVGAAHAGWRGLYDGVIEATVASMRKLGAVSIEARLGPCISPDSYEFSVGDLTTMALRFGPEVVGVTRDGTPALDMTEAVRAAVGQSGLDSSTIIRPPCTAADSEFFSHRARSDLGRQASVIWIEP